MDEEEELMCLSCKRFSWVVRKVDGSWKCGFCKRIQGSAKGLTDSEREWAYAELDRDARIAQFGPRWREFLQVQERIDRIALWMEEAEFTRDKGRILQANQEHAEVVKSLNELTNDESHPLWRKLAHLKERHPQLGSEAPTVTKPESRSDKTISVEMSAEELALFRRFQEFLARGENGSNEEGSISGGDR